MARHAQAVTLCDGVLWVNMGFYAYRLVLLWEFVYPQRIQVCEVYFTSVYLTKVLGLQYLFNPYPTAFPYGNGMVLQFYQQQESSTTKTVHKVINKGLKTYV